MAPASCPSWESEDYLRRLIDHDLISSSQAEKLSDVIGLRNRAVHDAETDLSKGEAEFVIKAVQRFLDETETANCQ